MTDIVSTNALSELNAKAFAGPFRQRRVNEIGTLLKGRGISKKDISSLGEKCIRYADIYTTYPTVVHVVKTKVSLTVFRSALPLRVGDVVTTASGEDKKEIGKAIVCLDKNVCAGGDTNIVRSTEVDGTYLAYALNSSDSRTQKARTSQGEVVVHIGKDAIGNILINVPDERREQEAIALALSDTDSLIEALEILLTKKRSIMAATTENLIMGGMRLSGQNGQRVTRIIGNVVKMRRERISTLGARRATRCVDLEDLQSGTSRVVAFRDLSKKVGVRFGFKAEDILFGRLRVYLRKYWRASCDGVCSTEIWPLMADESGITSSYLAHVVKTEAFMLKASVSSGTHMPRADWGITSQMEILLPVSLDEQKAIALVLSDMDAEIHALQDKIRKTRMLKAAMAEELLTGRTRMLIETPTD